MKGVLKGHTMRTARAAFSLAPVPRTLHPGIPDCTEFYSHSSQEQSCGMGIRSVARVLNRRRLRQRALVTDFS